MRLTAKIKLKPTREQAQYLLETIEVGNATCNWISAVAWREKKFRQYDIHDLTYYGAREAFALSAQFAIRCIAKVADSYKKDKRTPRHFREHGAVSYDSKILRYEYANECVSIWTIAGRQEIPFTCGDWQREMLQSQKGESKLIYQRDKFYLLAPCEIEEEPEREPDSFLGIDLGIANIATDSDKNQFSGTHLNKVRHRNKSLRTKLQSKGTRAAKRKLTHLSGREARFANHVNHCISKDIVSHAKRTNQAIVLEDLEGIRQRAKAFRRAMRYRLHSWSFYDLQQKILYKAKLAGVKVLFVNPAYTSQRCSVCGHTARANRRTQSKFECQSCGYASHADYNAACNIAQAGAVSHPERAV